MQAVVLAYSTCGSEVTCERPAACYAAKARRLTLGRNDDDFIVGPAMHRVFVDTYYYLPLMMMKDYRERAVEDSPPVLCADRRCRCSGYLVSLSLRY